MMVDVIWQKGLHEYINPHRLDSAITLGGAAVCNTLKTHCTGRFEYVDTSAEEFSETYNEILALIDRIWADPVLSARYERLQQLIVTRGHKCMGFDLTNLDDEEQQE
jgi:hypothetical protein